MSGLGGQDQEGDSSLVADGRAFVEAMDARSVSTGPLCLEAVDAEGPADYQKLKRMLADSIAKNKGARKYV